MQEMDINFTLNGKEYKLSVPTNVVLLDVIRDKMHLTGTKEGCGRGECGEHLWRKELYSAVSVHRGWSCHLFIYSIRTRIPQPLR